MDQHFTETETHLLTKLSLKTLQAGRAGKGCAADLPYIKIGRSVRYSETAIRAWLARHTMIGGAPAAPDQPTEA